MHVPNVGTDDWQCAVTWLPMIGFQQAREAFAVSKEVNEMRNETKKHQDEALAMAAIAVQRSNETVRSAIRDAAGLGGAPMLLASD